MAATDFVTESQIDSLTTTVATAVKGNTTALAAHISDSTAAHAASAISIVDSGALYTATDVEAALAEVRTVANAAAGGGTAINDAATNTTDAWSSQKIADEISDAITALVDGAPGALDTLNEIAAALNDDAGTVSALTTAVGNRLRFDAAQSLSGPQKAQALTNLGIVASTVDFAAAFTTALA